MKEKYTAIVALLSLRSIPKFEPDASILYHGLENESIRHKLTDLTNKCIDDFIFEIRRDESERNMRQTLRKGLTYFETLTYSLDSEDRERICRYFEEMMDAIGMESSDGILNRWMYGFDV